jgi:predicted nucleotidyltransferase
MFELVKIKKHLNTNPDIIVAYLFGSGAGGEEVVNDLDILILADEKANRLKIQLELINNLSKLTGLTADKIDNAKRLEKERLEAFCGA